MGGIFGGGNSYQQQPQQYLGGDPNYFSGGPGSQPFYAGDDYGTAGPGGQGTDQNYGGGGAMYANEGGNPTAGGGGILDWLGSERGQRAMQQLGGFSAGLLQGSAPSLQPRNFSTGLGAGMAGMQQAGSQYYTDALRRAQAQQAQAKVADLQTWSKDMQRAAANATGLPPGYMPGAPGMPGTTGGGTPPVQAPASAGGSGGGGLGGWGPLAQPAIGALNTAGVSTAGQQAIMAHGLAEGGFNVPWNVGDNGNSFGHWQFNKGGELPGYLDWAQGKGNPQDTGLQAQYVAQRVEEIHPGFSKVTDPAQAMSMVADFERYKGYQTDKRLGFLADAQKAMGGGQLEQRMPIPQGPGRLADTAFQMPSNMAAGLEGPAPAPGGILPAPPAMPSITQPQPQPNTTLASGLRPPVAPIVTTPQAPAEQPATTGSSASAAAARVAAAGAPTLAEGDSIAYGLKKFGGLQGNPVGGRNPEQVLQNIDSNLKNDPNYYRGKTVMLSSGVMNGPGRIDLVPDQIQRIQDAGGKVILAGVDTGKFAGHNGTLAQMAAEAGVPFAGPLPTNDVHPGPDGYRQYLARVQRGAARLTGAPAGVPGGGEGQGSSVSPAVAVSPAATGAPTAPVIDLSGQPAAGPAIARSGPAPVVGAAQPAAPSPAAVSPGVPPPAPAGTLTPGGPLAPPPAAAPAGVAQALARGTAPGMPQIPPEPLPAPPAPPPGAATAPPVAPPVSPAATTAGPAGPNAMPGAIAPPPVAAPPRPLPMPNLGAVQPPGAGGLPPYDVAAARRAQVLSIVGAATGHPVPAYLAEQAGLPNKAVEQQWAMQKQLYGAQLQAAQAQWNAASELQKQQIAHSQGMETEQYKSELGIRAKNFELGRWYNPQTQSFEAIPGAAGVAGGQAGAVAQAQEDEKAKHQMVTVPIVQPNGSMLDTPMTQYDFNQRTKAQGNRPPQPGDIVGKPTAALAPDYEYRRGPDGVVTAQPIANTPAAQKAQDLARTQALADRQLQVSRDAVVTSANRLEDLVKNSTLPTTGIIGTKIAPYYQPSKDVEALIQTMESRTTLDQLQAARAGSATGASGFGALSDVEGAKLASAIANLKQSQSKDQFLQNLQIVKQAYIDAVHGPGAYKQMSDASVLQAPKTQPPVGARTATGPDGPMYEYAPGKWRKM